MPFSVILPAAGRSTRFGQPTKKIFAEIDGRAVWLRAADAFATRADVKQIIVAVAPNDMETFISSYGQEIARLGIQLVNGGDERVDSIRAALACVDTACDYVAVHDAARPCVDKALIDRVFLGAVKHGACVPGLPVAETLKRVDKDGRIECTVPRTGLATVQTPQAFRRDWLQHAYEIDGGETPTDDAQLIESAGHSCVMVEGSASNIKITRAEDLTLAEKILSRS
jgi:2-C-methyl-D-erythritol 4-phosphate cytidylyltransferase